MQRFPKVFTAFFLLLVLGIQGFGFQDDLPSGVIVLKDGRLVAIRGEYEVFEKEVHFTDARGTLMTLPLSKVDLKATEARNKELGLSDQAARHNDIVSQVEEYKRKNAQNNDGLKMVRAPQDLPPPPEVEESLNVTQIRDLPGLDENEKIKLELLARNIEKRFEELGQTPWFITLTLLIIMGLLGLVSFIVQIVLIFSSFTDSRAWGLFLVLAFLSPYFFSFMAFFSPLMSGSLAVILPLAPGIASLTYHFLLFLFILNNRSGSRFKLVAWIWLLPLLALFLLLGYFTFLCYPALAEYFAG